MKHLEAQEINVGVTMSVFKAYDIRGLAGSQLDEILLKGWVNHLPLI